MAIQIKKASRQQVKIKIALSGPSGSGKTMSALKIAFGLCGDWEKICVIDTENRSSQLYSHLGDYNVIELEPPYTPERYIEAIKAIKSEGMEAAIIDSVSHEWEGKGGMLEMHNNMPGNSFTNWSKLTPRHNAFIDTILHTDIHIISTTRSKTDYVLVEKNGKQVPEKVGMKAITREGFEFDQTISFDLDIKNFANASKDRTGLFYNKPAFVPSEETGRLIKQWCESGSAFIAESKPELSGLQFGKIVARFNGGETDVFDKALEKFSFNEEQSAIIRNLVNPE